MDIKYIRSSSYNTYNECPHKYFLEYVLGINCLAGKKALLGTIIHHVLEILARNKQNNHYLLNDKYIDPEYLLKICYNRYYQEEKHRFEFKKADYKFCQKSIEKVLNSLYNPLKLNIIDTEFRFQIPMNRNGFYYSHKEICSDEIKDKGWLELRGTVDLITEINKETLEIIDYKTGKRNDWITGKLKDYEYLSSKDIQLRIYDLAIFLAFPQYPNRLMTINFINDGGIFTVCFSKEDREETYSLLQKFFKNVEKDYCPCRLKETNPKDASWKCKNVCHFGKTKNKEGVSVCDKIFAYMTHNTMENTILKIEEIKKNKKLSSEGSTSNRRNVY